MPSRIGPIRWSLRRLVLPRGGEASGLNPRSLGIRTQPDGLGPLGEAPNRSASSRLVPAGSCWARRRVTSTLSRCATNAGLRSRSPLPGSQTLAGIRVPAGRLLGLGQYGEQALIPIEL